MTSASGACLAGAAALALLAASSLAVDPVLLWNASASMPTATTSAARCRSGAGAAGSDLARCSC